jgi:hypothetical protein
VNIYTAHTTACIAAIPLLFKVATDYRLQCGGDFQFHLWQARVTLQAWNFNKPYEEFQTCCDVL